MAGRRAPGARGQHFLRGNALADLLVREAGIARGEPALDLGAGPGILTAALVRAGARTTAVELDPLLAARLRARFAAVRDVEVVEADAARLRFPDEPFAVVANLPFGSGTAILRSLLDPRVPLRCAVVVVQWELAVKRCAIWPSTLLGAWWSAWHELTLVRRLPRSAFAPPPAVDAAVLRSARRDVPYLDVAAAADYERFLHRGFAAGAAAVVPPRTLRRLAGELGFDARARPWDLDARQWAELFGATRHLRAAPRRSVRPAR